MKKILVVFTGGTIGSVASEGAIATADSARFKLLELFKQQDAHSESVAFDTLQPIQILSENLAPPGWKRIIEAIESAHPANYDGIIVTHGTDTLAYSAAALSFYFHALNQPLLLVSSDYPLENPQANGLANFSCAVEFIRRQVANGVFVPYRNAGQDMQIHLATRLASSLQLSGDFYSVQNRYAWQHDGNSFIQVNTAQTPDNQDSPTAFDLKPEFSNRLLVIKPYPGLDYSHFNLVNVDAVLHDLYHSGTACASANWGAQHSLVEFLQHCRSAAVPLYLAPAWRSENAYQSTHELLSHGALMLWNMSIEAAYVKLLLAYGNFKDHRQITDFMNRDLAGEHIPLPS